MQVPKFFAKSLRSQTLTRSLRLETAKKKVKIRFCPRVNEFIKFVRAKKYLLNLFSISLSDVRVILF